ncbi:MAG: polyribonucleotide nucleotidyltransferase [candidate division NC10 bacterium]|nr:polyribonucleotide nucleotidyltransferase [candidate division NC10 bacterium]
MIHQVKLEIEGKELTIEAGRVARAADGAVLVRYGDTVVLVTAVASKQPREGVDFFPLTVDYQEKAYAAGKIPGGFFKREGRPGEKETLTSRLIDRPVRPLFPHGYRQDVQIIGTVLSADQENDPDVLAMVGASCALTISPIPFLGPMGAVRVGRRDGRFVLNPTYAQLDKSDLDLVVAGTEAAVVMIEGGAREVPEEVVAEAIKYGHRGLQGIIRIQRELAQMMGIEKPPFTPPAIDTELKRKVDALCREKVRALAFVADKEEQQGRRQELLDETLALFQGDPPEVQEAVKETFAEIERDQMRRLVLEEKRRPDGRAFKDIRPISCEIGMLPRTHGSSLFTRGQTQALVITTLGTTEDEQRLDDLEPETSKRFMLHYYFPPFSVGEVRFLRGPGRREIGHGALAERALLPVLPNKEEFPYTLRIVSDILESNGSSSMATVCGASLSLMDAGVPMKAAVAGVAMGLVMEGDRFVILTDIMGLEDHLGDMDFKVAGTRKGVTAVQMDIKVQGVTPTIMAEALHQAKEARDLVLDVMDRTITSPRPNISLYAPRLLFLKIPVDKIGEVIGPGGKVIRGIIEETGAKIDISDDGTVEIASTNEAAAKRALEIISKIIEVPEVGKTYLGKVKRITEFGAFVEILPGTDGLLHISQIAEHRVHRVEDVLSEGDEVMVKVVEIDKQGKIRLSRKELLGPPGKGVGPPNHRPPSRYAARPSEKEREDPHRR